LRHHRVVLALLVVLTAGCAETELRSLKPEERPTVTRVFEPLLRAAYGDDATKCRVSIGVEDATHYDVRMRRREAGPCDILMLLTAPTLTELTPKALQTLLAHEFGHLEERHATGDVRATETVGARTDTGHRSRLSVGNQQFKPDEEAAADAAAARLLLAAWRGNNVGCLATADLYEDIAKDRKRWGTWLSRHPFPERRVDAVVKACAATR